MRHYESVLNKVAPMFYKLEQYRNYFKDEARYIRSYLESAKVPVAVNDGIDLSVIKNINYYFYINKKYYLHTERTLGNVVMTTKRKHFSTHEEFTLDEITVNLILNKFSFENKQVKARFEYHLYFPYGSFPVFSHITLFDNFKDLFITLVGRSTYDTIRRNIK